MPAEGSEAVGANATVTTAAAATAAVVATPLPNSSLPPPPRPHSATASVGSSATAPGGSSATSSLRGEAIPPGPRPLLAPLPRLAEPLPRPPDPPRPRKWVLLSGTEPPFSDVVGGVVAGAVQPNEEGEQEGSGGEEELLLLAGNWGTGLAQALAATGAMVLALALGEKSCHCGRVPARQKADGCMNRPWDGCRVSS